MNDTHELTRSVNWRRLLNEIWHESIGSTPTYERSQAMMKIREARMWLLDDVQKFEGGEQPVVARDNLATSDLLSMADVTVSPEAVSQWTDRHCEEANAWAAAICLFASDNDNVVIPTKPSFLPFADTELRSVASEKAE